MKDDVAVKLVVALLVTLTAGMAVGVVGLALTGHLLIAFALLLLLVFGLTFLVLLADDTL